VQLTLADHLLAGLAAIGAGVVNAVAGGGTLITFPTLVALGVPSVRSNMTNTVALCPGYFGGALAQRGELHDQRRRLRQLSAVAAVGGVLGSILLVLSPEDLFDGIVPFLLLLACALLACQAQLRKLIRVRHDSDATDAPPSAGVMACVLLASVYGGYFGAGLGIVVLATLGILLDDSLPRLNALKSAIALVTNVVAALFFGFSGHVVWSLTVVMAPASLVGGAIGGRLVGRLNPQLMRAIVITIGLAVAIKYLVT
jgi:uncharacterized membrane protein YfcA